MRKRKCICEAEIAQLVKRKVTFANLSSRLSEIPRSPVRSRRVSDSIWSCTRKKWLEMGPGRPKRLKQMIKVELWSAKVIKKPLKEKS